MPIKERNASDTLHTGVEVANNPYLLECPREGCYYRVVCKTREEALTEEAFHNCPRKQRLESGATMDVDKTVVYKMWQVVDAKMDDYASHHEPMKTALGNEMRGMAVVMAMVMAPYFNSADEIVAEIVARKKARDSGEDRQTNGIGYILLSPEESVGTAPWAKAYDGGYTGQPEFMADPPPGYPQDKVDAARAAVKKKERTASSVSPRKTVTSIPSKLSEGEIATIRKAVNEDDFPIDMMMTAYSCTRAEIMAVLKED